MTVFFAEAGESSGAVTIGFTVGHPLTRLAAWQPWNSEPLRLLVMMPGGGALQRAFAESFAHLRTRPDGDWFTTAPELLAVVAGLRAIHGAPPEELPIRKRSPRPRAPGLSIRQAEALRGAADATALLATARDLVRGGPVLRATHREALLLDCARDLHRLGLLLQDVADRSPYAAGARATLLAGHAEDVQVDLLGLELDYERRVVAAEGIGEARVDA